jgi:hypothetical protein
VRRATQNHPALSEPSGKEAVRYAWPAVTCHWQSGDSEGANQTSDFSMDARTAPEERACFGARARSRGASRCVSGLRVTCFRRLASR